MKRDYDMERAEELGAALGYMAGVLMMYDIGMKEKAIATLRTAHEQLRAKSDARQKVLCG